MVLIKAKAIHNQINLVIKKAFSTPSLVSANISFNTINSVRVSALTRKDNAVATHKIFVRPRFIVISILKIIFLILS